MKYYCISFHYLKYLKSPFQSDLQLYQNKKTHIPVLMILSTILFCSNKIDVHNNHIIRWVKLRLTASIWYSSWLNSSPKVSYLLLKFPWEIIKHIHSLHPIFQYQTSRLLVCLFHGLIILYINDILVSRIVFNVVPLILTIFLILIIQSVYFYHKLRSERILLSGTFGTLACFHHLFTIYWSKNLWIVLM